jgi:hypothetical protein
MMIPQVSSQLVAAQKQRRIMHVSESLHLHVEKEVLKPTRGPPHHVTTCHQQQQTVHLTREMRRHEHLNPLEAISNSLRNQRLIQP